MQHILLAISGLNPQIITEALYCLHMDGRSIEALHIITTRLGRNALLSSLLDGGNGKFYQFCAEYGMDSAQVDFHARNLHTPKDRNGRELEDILTQEDNEALLALCLQLAARLTADQNAAVYFLVAGGRKTMTSCLSFAAQIYGRRQDRIYHVLVSPEFEGHQDFWYPPRDSVLLELRDKNGRPFYRETRYASVQLIPIPFLSLRRQLPGHLLAAPDASDALLAALIREEERIFTISLETRTVSCGTIEANLKPALLAVLAFFAQLRLQNSHPMPQNQSECPPWFLESGEILGQQRAITALYKRIIGSRISTMSDTGITSLNAENFRIYKSRINKTLRQVFGTFGDRLAIQSFGTRPNTRYGLRIDKKQLVLK